MQLLVRPVDQELGQGIPLEALETEDIDQGDTRPLRVGSTKGVVDLGDEPLEQPCVQCSDETLLGRLELGAYSRLIDGVDVSSLHCPHRKSVVELLRIETEALGCRRVVSRDQMVNALEHRPDTFLLLLVQSQLRQRRADLREGFRFLARLTQFPQQRHNVEWSVVDNATPFEQEGRH